MCQYGGGTKAKTTFDKSHVGFSGETFFTAILNVVITGIQQK